MRAAILAAVLLAMVVPATAMAADPPTLGGTLGATRSEVVIESSATVPTTVTLSAPAGWQLAETSFLLDAGSRHVVKITTAGEDGQIIAVMQAVEVAKGTDRSALVMALGLPKPTPPGPQWLLLLLIPALLVVGLFTTPWRRNRRASPSVA